MDRSQLTFFAEPVPDAQPAPDGRGFLFSKESDGNEFYQLYFFDLASGDYRLLSDGKSRNTDALYAREGSRYAFATTRRNGRDTDIHLADSGKPASTPLVEAEGSWSPVAWSPDGRQLLVGRYMSILESELYLVDIASGERRRFQPEAQSQPSYSAITEFFIRELGLAVLTPNVRGSAGYGKAYLALDNHRLREDSVRDTGSLLDWIATQATLDAKRVVVSGGSYGGYMSLAAMTHYNDRLAGGIDVVGISSFVSFLSNTQDYRRDLRRVEYGDERDPQMRAFLESISPLTHAAKISEPMLIVQGLNDPRVPVSESEQMVATIRNNGGEVWYLLARDEGHGFRKKANRDYYSNAVVLFLQTLIDKPPAAGSD